MKKKNIYKILDVALTIAMLIAIIAWVLGWDSRILLVIFNIYFAIRYFIETRNIDGVLLIDTSDPEKDVWRFELNKLDVIDTRKTIRLKIDKDADLSQNKQTL